MRKFLIPLMAASMFMPVAAQAEDGAVERTIRNHAERSSKNDNRSDNGPSRAQSRRSERSNSDRPVRIERAA